MRMAEEVYCSNQSSRAQSKDVDSDGRSHSDEWYRDTPTNSFDRILAVHDMIHNLYRPICIYTSQGGSPEIFRTRSSVSVWIWSNARLPVDWRVHQTVRNDRREMIAPFPAGVSVKRVKDTFRSGNFMVVRRCTRPITLRSNIRVRRWS
jgi:hypothetical protein